MHNVVLVVHNYIKVSTIPTEPPQEIRVRPKLSADVEEPDHHDTEAITTETDPTRVT